MEKVFIIKGISGTGKSSRVLQLILFFEQVMGYKRIPYYHEHPETLKDKEVGIFFEEPNILFIGKTYERDGVERFQGYDAVTGCFGGAALFSDFMKETGKHHHIVVEGAGVTLSNRLRPKFLFEYCGFTDQFYQYYNYENSDYGKEKYHERLMLRSGKVTEKDSMWTKCKSYEGEFKKVEEEAKELEISVMHFYDDETPDISHLGIQMLIYLHFSEEEILAFHEFCELIDYKSLNVFK